MLVAWEGFCFDVALARGCAFVYHFHELKVITDAGRFRRRVVLRNSNGSFVMASCTSTRMDKVGQAVALNRHRVCHQEQLLDLLYDRLSFLTDCGNPFAEDEVDVKQQLGKVLRLDKDTVAVLFQRQLGLTKSQLNAIVVFFPHGAREPLLRGSGGSYELPLVWQSADEDFFNVACAFGDALELT
ncbi:hypothetical protein H257_12587 [Aphanomyces astaci]|uniref:Uncharacterized protein n=1 Tax=Aphanomyces astaci TaxID=112090 RepID=W4FZN4_APHAT|nr:hypothetical protein H257_12587 [Aphanomyces astaci]ETV72476.1 hypothetical protein H257_12587 [Aphanomyces astaci]|eukprot:XP_009838158.1 hypothetical protein H257_12587 [Aphanomyces astaci]